MCVLELFNLFIKNKIFFGDKLIKLGLYFLEIKSLGYYYFILVTQVSDTALNPPPVVNLK